MLLDIILCLLGILVMGDFIVPRAKTYVYLIEFAKLIIRYLPILSPQPQIFRTTQDDA